MAVKLTPFDPAAYLTDAESVNEYLRIALETNDPREIVEALSDVTRARGGVDELAEETGLAPVLLTKALSRDGNPDLATLTRILAALGVRLTVAAHPAESVAA
ncbi:MAG: addiction module antidote protein [Acidobacteriota bacterium]